MKFYRTLCEPLRGRLTAFVRKVRFTTRSYLSEASLRLQKKHIEADSIAEYRKVERAFESGDRVAAEMAVTLYLGLGLGGKREPACPKKHEITSNCDGFKPLDLRVRREIVHA